MHVTETARAVHVEGLVQAVLYDTTVHCTVDVFVNLDLIHSVMKGKATKAYPYSEDRSVRPGRGLLA